MTNKEVEARTAPSSVPNLEMGAVQEVYLISYSQADSERFPTRISHKLLYVILTAQTLMMLTAVFAARKLTRQQNSTTKWLLNFNTVAISKEVFSNRVSDYSSVFKLQPLKHLEIHRNSKKVIGKLKSSWFQSAFNRYCIKL